MIRACRRAHPEDTDNKGGGVTATQTWKEDMSLRMLKVPRVVFDEVGEVSFKSVEATRDVDYALYRRRRLFTQPCNDFSIQAFSRGIDD